MTPEPHVEPYPGWVKLILWSIGAGLGVVVILGVLSC